MKVISIIGARPQFIKAAVLSRELRKTHIEILVHTGQHYDWNMSDVFFNELGIPSPDYNLGIGSDTHGKQTGEMLSGIEQVLLKEKPACVVVYGDTNSTLAGALAAAKLYIPIVHVEAGLRSFNRLMPEEINRLLADHLSRLLLCPTSTAVLNLKQEGITQGVHLVGDVMYNTLMWAVGQVEKEPSIYSHFNLKAKTYILATLHRAENTDNMSNLQNILDAFNQINMLVVWPVHPRTMKILKTINWKPAGNIRLIEPLGYLEMAALEKNASIILTDSGGVQKEAYWLRVPCITLRDETEWIETVESGWNQLVGAKIVSIIEGIKRAKNFDTNKEIVANPFLTDRVLKLMVNFNDQ